jgi:hypothetical protein
MHSIEDDMSMSRIFLSWCGVFTVFDLVFLFVGVFFKVIRVRSIYCCCWASVLCICYLLGWGNMCEIIAIWRRILELIRRFFFLGGIGLFSP